MAYLWMYTILFGFLLFTSPVFGYTVSKFVADHGDELSKGQQIKVLVKVKGDLESDDPAKRAKEIRYLQSAVLKFCSFAGAVNVKSHTWNNEFTAEVTTSLAEVIEQRNDVISVHILQAPIQLPQKLQEMLDENDIANLPSWIQKTIEWYNQGMISETELINAINYLNTKSSDEIISQVGKQVEKTKLRLNDVKSVRFNGGMPIVFSGNLSTESEFIPNAEILIVGDGPCPANGIISKGLTDKFGRYHIFTELMIWDSSDNMIKIHAEYLGDEIYLPSSSQDEVIVVYPTKDTKSC